MSVHDAPLLTTPSRDAGSGARWCPQRRSGRDEQLHRERDEDHETGDRREDEQCARAHRIMIPDVGVRTRTRGGAEKPAVTGDRVDMLAEPARGDPTSVG